MTTEREPAINAPWTVLLIIAVIVAVFCLQLALGPDKVVAAYGFEPALLWRGGAIGLVTAIFLHGGWAHLAGNSAFILAFGTPVARRMGADAKGAAAFFGFFLVCGVIGNLGFAAVSPGEQSALIGASGAAAGLMGAASRLMAPPPWLVPFRSQPVIGMAASWLVVNLIVAVIGWAPGSGGAPVAWQAHLAGYAAGLLLIAPTLRLLSRA
jgi:membrane associated rhomboid family serine protease